MAPVNNRVMQGFEPEDRKLLDAAAVAGHLVAENSMFAFLAAHRAEVFCDAGYADLFAPPGPGLAVKSRPTQMAAVLTLQVLHDYSDRETAEAVRFDVRWKVAIGAALDDAGFDPSTLVYWRTGSHGRSGRTGSMTRSARWRSRPDLAWPVLAGRRFDDPG